jgi:hypothetical protein
MKNTLMILVIGALVGTMLIGCSPAADGNTGNAPDGATPTTKTGGDNKPTADATKPADSNAAAPTDANKPADMTKPADTNAPAPAGDNKPADPAKK